MGSIRRIPSARVRAALGGVVACMAMAALAFAPPGPAAARALRSGHPAGVIGTPVTLATAQSLENLGHPFDVAASSTGTAYIGWISSTASDTTRKVHLCRLPVGATACDGGIQTIDALGPSSASGLRVLVDGSDTVHLVWFHDTANSVNGPNNAAIAQATAVHGLNLTAATDVITDAPSFGSLLTATLDPAGAIWTVAYAGVPATQVKVWHDATGPELVTTPWAVGYAQLAFTGGKAVLAAEKYGAISTGPSYATRSSGVWGSFHALAHTWAVGGNAALATTRHGLRIVTAINNASYRPVIASWNGTGFGTPVRTTDKDSCAASTHDGWADASGRLLDAGYECSNVVVTNYPDARHSAIVRFRAGGTPGHQPEVASGVRGIATVVWAISKVGGETLKVAHVRLPDATVNVSKKTTSGRVTVTGPRSCLPPVNVPVRWTHSAAKGWTFKSGSLKLDGHGVGSPLDGASLSSGTSHTLVGRASFARNGVHKTVRVSLSFTTCAKG